MRALTTSFIAMTCAVALAACGGGSGGGADDDGGGGNIDAGDGSGIDSGPPGTPGVGCTEADIDLTKPQCSNCADDDEDGLIDGFDPECTGPLDQREDSFATGIPGDNIDAKKQDCFFDGNSGADPTNGTGSGQISTCCLLLDGECPKTLGGGDDGVGSFNRATDCNYGAAEYCIPLTPPGCDCFGCCTICVDANESREAGCYDVLTNPQAAAGCSQETVGTDACLTCQKFTACSGGECNADPEDCILCPGETVDDLPEACNDQNVCPGGQTACSSSADCVGDQYCNVGCCTAGVP
jgi:hypothetical protein